MGMDGHKTRSRRSNIRYLQWSKAAANYPTSSVDEPQSLGYQNRTLRAEGICVKFLSSIYHHKDRKKFLVDGASRFNNFIFEEEKLFPDDNSKTNELIIQRKKGASTNNSSFTRLVLCRWADIYRKTSSSNRRGKINNLQKKPQKRISDEKTRQYAKGRGAID